MNLKVSKLLKDNGVFISITFAQPHFRKPLYAHDDYNWSIELHTIGETFHYFIYVMTKGQKLNPNDKKKNLNRNEEYLSFDFLLNFDLNENYLLKIDESLF